MKVRVEIDCYALDRKIPMPKGSVIIESAGGQSPNKVRALIDNGAGEAVVVLLASQIQKAAKNATHTVRGAMRVINELDVFVSAPATYNEDQALKPSDVAYLRSVNLSAFVELEFGGAKAIVKSEDLIAACENVVR